MVKKLLGDAVREERLRRNLSQNSLAEQAKISLRTVSDIENYIGNPQLETLYALATYLHISMRRRSSAVIVLIFKKSPPIVFVKIYVLSAT